MSEENEPQIDKEKVTFGEKTDRIKAWSQLIKSVTPFVWVAVIIIVIIPLLGRGFIASYLSGNSRVSSDKKEEIVIVDRTLSKTNELDRAIVSAIANAHTNAESFASEKLDAWVTELMTRVDNSFLDWYFSYFNQKKIEITVPFVWLSSAVAHRIDTKNPTPQEKVAEKFTQDFQTEFAKRVLRPKVAQLELERITRDTVNLYISELSQEISRVQSSYKIPQGDWERYLNDIAFTVYDASGNASNLSLKLLAGGSALLAAKSLAPLITGVGSKVAVTLAGKSAAKMAAKTGGAVAAKVGAEFLDPIVAVGIIIWDLWDYNQTVKVSKPILREAILDYLQEVKASLLDNSQNGIMAAIYQVEDGIFKSVQKDVHPAYNNSSVVL